MQFGHFANKGECILHLKSPTSHTCHSCHSSLCLLPLTLHLFVKKQKSCQHFSSSKTKVGIYLIAFLGQCNYKRKNLPLLCLPTNSKHAQRQFFFLQIKVNSDFLYNQQMHTCLHLSLRLYDCMIYMLCVWVLLNSRG